MSETVTIKLLEKKLVEAEADAAVCKAVADNMAEKLTAAHEEIAKLKVLLGQSGIRQAGEDKNP